ncbi:MAG: hypothetical protein ACE5FT_02585 [Candidatus Nanoarchaeia archaeon]
MAKSKTETDYMDWFFPVLVIVVLVAFLGWASRPGEVMTPDTPQFITLEAPYSFEEMFYEVRRLDQKFNTDFRNESLNGGPVMRMGAARQYLGYIDKLRVQIANQTEPAEDKYIHYLLDAREAQLNSEIYFQQAMAIGKTGVFRSPESCEHEDDILRAAELFNLSRHHGGKALLNFDRTLALKSTWSLVGVNENKPRFYDKVFKDMGELVEVNTQSVRKICHKEYTLQNSTSILTYVNGSYVA